jgi:hypothetical protein
MLSQTEVHGNVPSDNNGHLWKFSLERRRLRVGFWRVHDTPEAGDGLAGLPEVSLASSGEFGALTFHT